MTLRGKECIELADVLVYDFLFNAEFLKWAKSGAELVYAGKNARSHSLTQEEINALLVEKAREGKVVTRLKGGDPFLFGRGGEEAEALAEAGVDFDFVPGISSALAAPAYAGIPVTHRDHNSQLTIFTGHENPGKGGTSLDYAQLAAAPGTKVMLMGVKRLREITSAMLGEGADGDTPAALVRWASIGQQETLVATLATIADRAEKERFAPPAVAVFGSVVALRDKLDWFESSLLPESRPLLGKSVVVTRTTHQAGATSARLRDLGAEVLEIPAIRIENPEEEDLREFIRLVAAAHSYEWLIFTSPNGVEKFFETFYKIRNDAREIGGARIAAVGPATARKLAEYRMATDLLPERHLAEGLIEAFTKSDSEFGSVENCTMLWVRPEEARDELAVQLGKAGAILDQAIAYRTVPVTDDPTGNVERFREEGADFVTFTSASTVDGFLDLGLDIPDDTRIVTIGPLTSAAVEENGHQVDREAEEHTIDGLVSAVVELAGEEGGFNISG